MERVNHDWFHVMAATYQLPREAVQELRETGFSVMAGPVAQDECATVAAAYDSAVLAAHPNDISVGRSTTRVNDFVNRGPDFDQFYVYPPLLAACCSVIGQPFKLSTMHARTVEPSSPAQELHIDFKGDADGWPMVGFIIMVDDFLIENGATRFVAGSHLWSQSQGDLLSDPAADFEGQISACGPAGSIVIYNGSVWHGHGANLTSQPRRSIQGAYIRREVQGWADQGARIRPDTMSRIGDLAKYLLDLPALA
jgi:ectoine hydroxylase-related dioxygenase (phytanoyl-CoA dioxygenase family)